MDGKIYSTKNKFLKLNLENKEFNQYWFSEKTINFIINQIKKCTLNIENYKVAMISSPSIFFSLEKDMQENCYLFEIDEKLLKKHKNCVYYDYNKFSVNENNVDFKNYKEYFDYIIIDPPFIVKEAWIKYAEFTNYIKKNNSNILTCSIFENEKLLYELLKLNKKQYQPSIPNLVYQYNFYSNYNDDELNKDNEELVVF